MKRIALFALACTWLAACERPDPLGVAPAFQTSAAPSRGGPIILMGIDAEDGSPANHGSPSIYAGVVRDGILANVTNGGAGILGIGCGKLAADDVTRFWTTVATAVMQPLVCVNGPIAISAARFDGFAMIAVVSDLFNTPSGGLTQAELNALNARDVDVANFINTGGGLFGLSNCALTNPYGYLGGVGGFRCGFLGANPPSAQDNIEPTPAGRALGITSTNLDVCCWHDTYDVFPGFLEVLAFYPDLGGRPAAAIGGAKVIITQGITLDPATAQNPAGSAHRVTATVKGSDGNPVVNREVRFKVISGPNAGQASPGDGVCTILLNCHTDNNGQVSWTYTSNGRTGTDNIEACFTDAQGVTRCAQATKEWVAGAPAKLILTPPVAENTVGTRHCVTATVTDLFGNPVSGVTVIFSVGPSVPTTFPRPPGGTATTDANGQATFCYTASLPGVDRIHAFADLNGDRMEQLGMEPSGDAEKTWIPPASTALCEVKITDGGWIIANNNDRANFGGNAKVMPDGTVQGQQEYQDQGPAQPMNVHSTEITATTCSDDHTMASIFGKATIDGSGPHVFRIDLTDGGSGGSSDTYGILLDNGYVSGQHRLGGGNVTIHNN